ncbi:aldehyde dehydrogenase [Pelomyxa schiedti]|nr:aldehyde dehydrogenase [Pelomyxa schiedti]
MSATPASCYDRYPFLQRLGIERENLGVYNGTWFASGAFSDSVNPTTGEVIARVKMGTKQDYEACLAAMDAAKAAWAAMGAPKRGDIVRQLGEAIRPLAKDLGALVSLEMGKISKEGVGEIQEVIDVCDYATGLSRAIAGQVLPSERPGHVILETWNPLGHLGLITAFNFPAAVWSWNAAINLICGNCQIWKGASTTQLVTIAMTKVVAKVLQDNGLPGAICSMINAPGRVLGDSILEDPRIRLVSFTGSTSIGIHVSEVVHRRFGRTILELGGNNAVIAAPSANLELLLPAVVFGAVGTCGQRCTSTRRVIIHDSIFDTVVGKMVNAYKNIIANRIGDPLDPNTLVGPLHTQAAVREYEEGIAEILKQGGKILVGGHALRSKPGNFVEPTIVEINHDAAIVKTELFVPIVYVIKYHTFEDAVAYNNEVPQGLSSSLFSQDAGEVFSWTGPLGSDCGLVNVNTGTSGAEIGGAFGGEKETGGGRESGSDSWKQYMKRGTCTINYSKQLPLAQGLSFS